MQRPLDSAAPLGLVQDQVWVNDTASQFKYRMMAALEKSLGVDRRFSVANSPWSNGIYERMIHEERRNTQDWVELVPAVQWALFKYCAPRKTWLYSVTAYHAIFGRAPRAALSTLMSSTGQDWQVDVLVDKAIRKKVATVVEVQSVDRRTRESIMALIGDS